MLFSFGPARLSTAPEEMARQSKYNQKRFSSGNELPSLSVSHFTSQKRTRYRLLSLQKYLLEVCRSQGTAKRNERAARRLHKIRRKGIVVFDQKFKTYVRRGSRNTFKYLIFVVVVGELAKRFERSSSNVREKAERELIRAASFQLFNRLAFFSRRNTKAAGLNLDGV